MRSLLSLLTIFLFLTACSSTQVKHTKYTQSSIRQIDLLAVQYFAPSYEASDLDEENEKIQKISCEAPSQYYPKFYKSSSPELIQCLSSIQTGAAQYRFSFQAQPRLEIDADESTQPDCLKKLLPVIPLPRELYFLGRTQAKESLDCYSSSFNTHSIRALKVRVPFPLSRPLKTERDLLIWFMVTTFDLLSQADDAGGKLVRAGVVPEMTCKSCFSNDLYFEEKKSERMAPVYWDGQDP